MKNYIDEAEELMALMKEEHRTYCDLIGDKLQPFYNGFCAKLAFAIIKNGYKKVEVLNAKHQ